MAGGQAPAVDPVRGGTSVAPRVRQGLLEDLLPLLVGGGEAVAEAHLSPPSDDPDYEPKQKGEKKNHHNHKNTDGTTRLLAASLPLSAGHYVEGRSTVRSSPVRESQPSVKLTFALRALPVPRD